MQKSALGWLCQFLRQNSGTHILVETNKLINQSFILSEETDALDPHPLAEERLIVLSLASSHLLSLPLESPRCLEKSPRAIILTSRLSFRLSSCLSLLYRSCLAWEDSSLLPSDTHLLLSSLCLSSSATSTAETFLLSSCLRSTGGPNGIAGGKGACLFGLDFSATSSITLSSGSNALGLPSILVGPCIRRLGFTPASTAR